MVEVVGLGPAGPELLTAETAERLDHADHVVLRTRRHPAAMVVPDAASFDDVYEREATFEDVYRTIVDELLAMATSTGHVLYAVPGSPSVAERTVDLLRRHGAVRDGEVELVVRPALSFLDLAFDRLGVDPVAAGIRLVDGTAFSVEAAGATGPLIVAQCWDRSILSAVKLAPESPPSAPVTVLSHLGLHDEQVTEVPWDEVDRVVEPDHLTSLWIPPLEEPVAAELVRLDELVRVLRERCPWDRRQTHGSLRRHLLEEAHEVLEALDAVAAEEAADAGGPPGDDGAAAPDDGPSDVDRAARRDAAMADLEEELGDLLFQVYFHARLAAESGRFTLADVARGVHDKLVDRHPHVFGDDDAVSAEQVVDRWEVRKLVEKKRTSVTQGIPASLPALALAAKLQRKSTAVGMVLPELAEEVDRAVRLVSELGSEAGAEAGGGAGSEAGAEAGSGAGSEAGADGHPGSDAALEQSVGDALFAVASVARDLGVDPEAALRSRLAVYRAEIEAAGRAEPAQT